MNLEMKNNWDFFKWMLIGLAVSMVFIFMTSAGSNEKMNADSDYCDCFPNGWEDGYCYEDFGCIAPIAPVCPIPTVSESNTCQGGYNKGFVMGRRKKAKDNG